MGCQSAERDPRVVAPRDAEVAVDAARNILENEGGGELLIHGDDGQIRSKVTVAPGNDLYPPKG